RSQADYAARGFKMRPCPDLANVNRSTRRGCPKVATTLAHADAATGSFKRDSAASSINLNTSAGSVRGNIAADISNVDASTCGLKLRVPTYPAHINAATHGICDARSANVVH